MTSKQIYYQEHREEILEKKRLYHIENKAIIAEKSKIYRENNKELMSARDKMKYEKNKEILQEKITCECGGTHTKHHQSRHLKTKKHLDFIKL